MCGTTPEGPLDGLRIPPEMKVLFSMILSLNRKLGSEIHNHQSHSVSNNSSQCPKYAVFLLQAAHRWEYRDRYSQRLLEKNKTIYTFLHSSIYKSMQDFQCLQEIGHGSFGRVIKVRKHDEQEVSALKLIKLNSLNAHEKDNALNEVRLLASIACPNVITYKSAFFEESSSSLCILMEFADGGDLAGLIKKKCEKKLMFNESFIWQVACDLLRGLKTLHSSKIIHRDIKPANVFFVNGVAKIGDLNVSKVMEGKFASTQTGTPYYTSPQIWKYEKYDGKCDIWSLGCLIYELTSLHPPFTGKDIPGLSKKVMAGVYDPISSIYSPRLIRFVKKCLTVRMTDRPTASQLLDDEVFACMEAQDQGEIDLLDTIKCPRVLKLLQKKLPEIKSTKKLVTLKAITANDTSLKLKSKKIIASQKNLSSVQGKQNSKEQIKILQKLNVPVSSPQGIVRLPKINTHKRIFE